MIGVDPDLHHTGWAIVESPGRVVSCGVVRIPERFKNAEAAVQMCRALAESDLWKLGTSFLVVEGQQVYRRSQSRADPRNLLHLATISGAVIASVGLPAFLPTPRQWKGSVPKAIHQARTLTKLVGSWGFTRPTNQRQGVLVSEYPKGLWRGPKPPTATDWKHVVDAIGLASWGLKQ